MNRRPVKLVSGSGAALLLASAAAFAAVFLMLAAAPMRAQTPAEIKAAKAQMQAAEAQARARAARAQAAKAAAAQGAKAAPNGAKTDTGAQPSGGSPRLTAGPTYTSAEGKNDPQFPNVDVVFTLIGADGKPLQAKPGDLKLLSQGKELGTAKSIRTFDRTPYGITAILALDASGSMRGAPINAIHASIARFVNQTRKQDKVEVITFADDTHYDVPFGSSQDTMSKMLETVQPRGKFTRLYDGLLDALDQYTNSQPKRRQLVVISDGHDEGSKKGIADVLVKAKKLSVVIDCIGLTKDKGQFLDSLKQLSSETGGTFQRAMSAEDLDRFIKEGIDANRATPVAAFKTSNLAADNAVHSTQLRWTAGNLTAATFVSTPQGSLFRNPWLWVLGACFVAGVVLLAISWFGAKSGAKSKGTIPPPPGPPVAVPQPDGGLKPPPVAPVVSATPIHNVRKTPTSYESNPSGPGRTPTTPETLPVSGAFAPPRPAKAATPEKPISPAETGAPAAGVKDILGKERGKTRLASFFEAPENGPFAMLRVKTGDMAGAAIPMTAATFTLGALAGNHLILPGDPTMSGQHVRLFWEGSILKLEDMNSTNGTFLNGERLTAGRHLLRPGDEIRMGQTVMIADRA